MKRKTAPLIVATLVCTCLYSPASAEDHLNATHDATRQTLSELDGAWRSFIEDYDAAWKEINQSRDQIRESLATIKEARSAGIAAWEAIRTQRQQIKDASAAIDESFASFVAKYEAAWKYQRRA